MKKILFVLLPIFLFTVSLDANETTARIKGNVNIGGAEVTAVHVPTNISKTTTASESGSFNLSFLPIGGPYKVTVSKAGYVAQVITIPLLTSADPAKVSVSLISSAELEDIEVVASKLTKSDVQSGSVLSRERIDEIPTITRSIQDYVKFDPRVSINGANSRDVEISVMGRNARLNDFTIDGISFNDAFGLNDSGFSTMRNPISIDFVDEIVVDLTPYDVSRGNSVAGTITAVTKTGTNEFSGSVYYTERDEGDIGDLPNGEEYSGFSEEATAITLSGPIIKDKLFFF
ncbi:MAG: TonB-dependent receptor, partial [Gammaproteobacteria bacterium TMED225]